VTRPNNNAGSSSVGVVVRERRMKRTEIDDLLRGGW
jgi:hypothetical protein